MDSNKNSLQHNNLLQVSSGMVQPPSSSPSSSAVPAAPASAWGFINKDGNGAYDLGELDHALLLYLHNINAQDQQPSLFQHHKQNSEWKPHTLDIFPSKPMHIGSSSAKPNSGSSSSQPSKPKSDGGVNVVASASTSEPLKLPMCEESHAGSTSSGSQQDCAKTLDPKALRRLAQNREAARKSRLRKKAYVQQLESCRMKLTQLEQEIQRAWAQGIYFGGNSILGGEQGHPLSVANISSDAAIFDLEYARWLEEHHRLMTELRCAVEEQLPENEMRMYVDSAVAHFDEVINLKTMLAKSDVFHIFSGMWKTPAERCFMWVGGFRPSDLLKISVNQMEGVTEQQLVGLYGLQQSTQEAEEAISRSLEALNHSLSDSLSSDTLSFTSHMGDYMTQMAAAMAKLSTLEAFLQQADNLRHQTVHRLHQMLLPRQAARCFLAIADYFYRLRALSSLWLTRPRQD
nr:transcription factor HBP-1B(C38)-like isoform X2 [Ipomoea batatas]